MPGVTTVRWTVEKSTAGLVLVIVWLATACGAGPMAEGPDTTASSSDPTTVVASSPSTEVFFPKQRPGGDSMTSEARGELTLDAEGCLRVRHRDGAVVPVWHPGLELDIGGEEARVFNKEGQVVAQVGERILMGGGGASKEILEENELVDKQVLRELFERCPGEYWLVSIPSEVRILS